MRKFLAGKAGKTAWQALSTQTQNSSPLEFCYNHITVLELIQYSLWYRDMDLNVSSEHKTWEMAVSAAVLGGCWSLLPLPNGPRALSMALWEHSCLNMQAPYASGSGVHHSISTVHQSPGHCTLQHARNFSPVTLHSH